MIIGREAEVKILDTICRTSRSEFVAVYGRRRIGKTFLIRKYFSKKNDCLYFEASGIKDGNTKKQLEFFSSALSSCFYNKIPIKIPATWEEAFLLLTDEIEKIKKRKVVVFFDELPWMCTRRSRLIQTLDYYWNNKWVKINNLKIIVCGSAASWMLNNLINAKGGLYNRLTRVLSLKPFDLRTTKQFLTAHKCKFNNKQVADIYMVTGGIPFYLDQISPALSVVQNISTLCFEENGLLLDEFPRLFKSLFANATISLNIVKIIASKRYGISREELLKKLKVKTGGWINDKIEEVEAAGFIVGFIPYGKKKDIYYRVIDEYTLFYLKWIAPDIKKGHGFSKSHWYNLVKNPSYASWLGMAFENLCLKHQEQIMAALKLQNIDCRVSSWRSVGVEKDGAQIDLLFDRGDDAVTICEIKYVSSSEKFKIDKSYAKNLENKIEIFKTVTLTKKQIYLAMITSFGIAHNLYSEDLIQNEVVLDDLYRCV
ncbi:MAG: AAA family ATPase [Oligoflexia bacterium]|nr:AAA family ATPase [Oligoflexia bacterium]